MRLVMVAALTRAAERARVSDRWDSDTALLGAVAATASGTAAAGEAGEDTLTLSFSVAREIRPSDEKGICPKISRKEKLG